MTDRIAPDISCMICEDVRQERHGKLSMIGCYFDSIIFEEAAWEAHGQANLAQLHFVCVVRRLEGPGHARWSILDPDDEPLGADESEREFEVNFKPGESHVLVLRLAPAGFKKLGAYKFHLNVLGQDYELPFLVAVKNTLPE